MTAAAGPAPLRVVQVLAPAPAGGAESVVVALCAGLRARGHAVLLAALVGPGDEDHPVPARARALGVEVAVLAHRTRAYLAERAAIVALLRRFAPDVAHTHGYRADVVAGLAARAVGVPRVTTAHGFIGGDWRGVAYEWLQLQAARRAAAAVAVSTPIVERYRRAGVPGERIHLLRNAWSGREPLPRAAARRRLGLDPAAPLVGFVGRLSWEKGPDLLLEAAARLARAHVVFVGDGPDRTALAARAAALGLGERVHFLGLVPDAGLLAAALDAYALPSRTEGTPIALLEAMAARLPIVAAAVGGVPDVVSEAEAWLVPCDDANGLGAALGAALADPAAARARGDAARRRLERDFAPDAWLAAHEALYAALRAPGAGR
jgi:glycosyltransferase involved in cell wall biosynthesis